MNPNEIIINKKEHHDIYKWLSKNIIDYKINQRHHTLTSEGKINVYCTVSLRDHVTQIKYPFGYVKGYLSCTHCNNLTSLINLPEKVMDNFFYNDYSNLTSFIGFPKHINGEIYLNNKHFSNNPKNKEEYKLYLAMWLELFESVSNNDRKNYINNHKNKVDYLYKHPIITIEILKEYGF